MAASGVDYLQVAQADIAALLGQTVLDGGELLGCDLHARDCPAQSQKSPLVLTRPNSRSFTMHHLHSHRARQQRATTIAITPSVTRWHPAARAAGWTLLAMTLTVFVVFRLG